MLENPFAMVSSWLRWALLALGTAALPGCGPGGASPGTDVPGPTPASRARALVRPYVARNSLSAPGTAGAPAGASAPVPGPTAVVVGHRTSTGELRVGCVDSEDGAEALVRDAEDTR